MNTYKQGHDPNSTSSHARRTPETDAAFLLPHLKPTDALLYIGCGPGSITRGFARYITRGSITGVDLSPAVLEQARSLTRSDPSVHLSSSSTPAINSNGRDHLDASKTTVDFIVGNVLDRLAFDDDTFDVVFASQTLGHIPLSSPPLSTDSSSKSPRLISPTTSNRESSPDESDESLTKSLPVLALREMRRVLKPGGLLAIRDAVEIHAYPRHLRMKERFFDRQWRVLHDREAHEESVASTMPRLCRLAGFVVDDDDTSDHDRIGHAERTDGENDDHGNDSHGQDRMIREDVAENKSRLTMSGGSTIFHSRQDRHWLADRTKNMLTPGATTYQNWIAAGFDDTAIEDAVAAMEEWAATEDAWYIAVQCETLVRK